MGLACLQALPIQNLSRTHAGRARRRPRGLAARDGSQCSPSEMVFSSTRNIKPSATHTHTPLPPPHAHDATPLAHRHWRSARVATLRLPHPTERARTRRRCVHAATVISAAVHTTPPSPKLTIRRYGDCFKQGLLSPCNYPQFYPPGGCNSPEAEVNRQCRRSQVRPTVLAYLLLTYLLTFD